MTRTRNSVKLDVARAAVKEVQVVDTDIVLILADGRKVYVRDGAVQAMIDPQFTVEFTDGQSASGQDLLHQVQTTDVGRVAITGATSEGAPPSPVVVTPAEQAPGVSAAPPPAKEHGGWQTYALIGTPLIGGVLGGVLGGKSSGASASTSASTSTATPSGTQTSTPTIFAVDGNDLVNAANKAAGVTIRGTAEASAAVTVNFGGTSKTATADSSGVWSVSYASAEVPADATKVTLSATAKSSSGTVSDPALRTVLVDTSAPASPSFNTVSSDDIVSPAERTANVVVSGTLAASEAGALVTLKWGSVTKSVVVDAAGNWSAIFAPSEIPAAGSYALSATATDLAGNVSSPAAHTVTINPAVTVSGVVTAGPLVAGHGLTLNLYSGDGTLLASGVKIGADGTFSASNVAVGPGEVLVARVIDSSTGSDYLDEATGSTKNLTATLMSTVVVSGLSQVININPLTTIVAQKAGLASDGTGSLTSATVTSAIAAVAKAFGLSGTDVTTTAVVTTNGGGYNSADGLSVGEKLGALLATLSGMDSLNGGNAQTAINALTQQISGAGVLSNSAIVALMNGAAAASGNVTGSLNQVVSDLVHDALSSANLTIAAIAGDDVISAAEVTGLTVSGTVSAGATAVKLHLGSQTVNATVNGTAWTYTLSSSDVSALGADGPKVITVDATLANGSTISSTRPVLLHAVPPSVPTITAVATDDIVNAAEKAAGVVVSGIADPGTKVTLTWGSNTEVVTAGSNGSWTATFPSNQVPSDGASTLTVSAADSLGNVSASVPRDVLIDTVAPDAPTVASIGNNGLVGAALKSTGLFVSGTGEVGDTVTVTWDTFTGTAVVDPTGKWTLNVPSSKIPGDGSYVVSVSQSDVAGNPSTSATTAVTVKAAPPTTPTIANVAGDNIVSAAEKLSGVVVRGTGDPGTTIFVSWGLATKSAVVSSTGAWSTTFTSAQIPGDGSQPVTAYSQDQYGGTSDTRTKAVTVDTVNNPPVITSFAGDNVINLAEKTNGAVINGTAEAGATVTLTIGSVTKTALVATDGTWTMTLLPSEIPADGSYTVTALSTDVATNVSTSLSRTITVDTVAPSAPTISTVSGDNYINAAERSGGTTVAGTAEAGTTVTVVWGTTTKTATADANGNWTMVFSASETPGDGAYQISAVSADAAGNPSAATTRDVTVITGTAVPVISAVATDNVVNGAEKTAGVVVSGTAAASSAVAVTWGTSVVNVVTGSDGKWNATFSSAQIPADGSYTITAIATDVAGNVSLTGSRSVSIDTSVAAPVVNAFGTNGYVNADDANAGVSITGTGEASGTATIAWGSIVRTVPVDASGNWTATFAKSEVPTDGSQPVTVTITDRAGNQSIATTRSVIVDTLAPLAPVVAAVTGDNVINGAEKAAGVTVSGTGEALAKVTVSWGSVTKTVTADSNGAWSATYVSSEVPANGATVLTAYQTDVAGNRGSSTATNVTVNAIVPPSPTIAVVAGDDIVNASEKGAGVTVSGTTTAGFTVNLVWGSATKSVTADSNGNWSAAFTSGQVPGDGSTSILATAVDLSGNPSQQVSRSVTVDTAAPLLPTIDAVTGDNIVNSSERSAGIVVSGTAEANASVAIAWGSATKTVTANGAGKWTTSFGTSEIPQDGATTMSVTATDVAGNTSPAATRSVLVDTAAPAAPTIGIVAVDDKVNASEASSSISITGTAEANAVVSVQWGSVTKTVTANGSGVWTASYASNEVPANGSTTVSAFATDAAGNVGPQVTRGVLVDTVAPSTPVISAVAGDDNVNNSEKTAGIVISGSAEAGSSVSVVWGSVTKTTTAATNGTWTVTYASGEVPLDGSTTVRVTATDAAGNASSEGTRSVLVDTGSVPIPTLDAVTGDNIINSAEQAAGINITGKALASATVTVTIGSVTHTVQADSSGNFTAPFASSEIPTTGPLSVQVSQTNTSGNTSATVTQSVAVDTTVPTVSSVALTSATGIQNNYVNAGDTVTATVTFSEAVTVTGTPQLAMNIGGTIVQANYSSGSGTTAIKFTYTIQSGQNDANGISFASNAVTLNGGTIRDAAGNDASLGHGSVIDNSGYLVDTSAPGKPTFALGTGVAGGATAAEATQATGVVLITSEVGATIDVTLTGAGSATVTKTLTATSATTPLVLTTADLNTLGDGTVSVSATATDPAGNASAAATTSFVLDRTAPNPPILALGTGVANGATQTEAIQASGVVTVGAESGSSVSVLFTGTNGTVTKTVTGAGATATAVTLTAADVTQLGDGLVTVEATATDSAGNTSTPAIQTGYFKLDTVAPTVSSVALTAATGYQNSRLKAGSTVTATVTFSEAVTVTGTPNLAMKIGSTIVQATYASGSGTNALAFTYTILAGQTDTDGISFASNAITLNGGTITDTAGNDASLGHASVTDNGAYLVDTTAPVAPTFALGTGVAGGATAAEATQATGVVLITSEIGATLNVTLTGAGSGTVSKTLTAASATTPLTLTAADLTTLGDGTVSVSVTATDLAGNTGSAGTTSFLLDRQAPNPPIFALGTGVIDGATQAEAIQAGGVITVGAESGSSVSVTFTGTNGTVTKTVTGAGATATAVTLTASDVTQLGDGLVTVSATATDAAGNVSTPATQTGYFTIDTVAPTVSTVGLTSATGIQNNFVKAGSIVTATVTFSETVTVTGTPNLALNIGGTTVQASYASGSGTNALRFTYTILAGQNDADGISFASNAITLNGGTIRDAAGNTAALSHASVTDNGSYLVDTTAPTTTASVTLSSASDWGTAGDGITMAKKQTYNVAGAVGDIVSIFNDGNGNGVIDNGELLTQLTLAGTTATIDLSLASGTYSNLKAITSDLAGNYSTGGATSIAVLTVVPDINTYTAPTRTLKFTGTSGSTSLSDDYVANQNGGGVGEILTLSDFGMGSMSALTAAQLSAITISTTVTPGTDLAVLLNSASSSSFTAQDVASGKVQLKWTVSGSNSTYSGLSANVNYTISYAAASSTNYTGSLQVFPDYGQSSSASLVFFGAPGGDGGAVASAGGFVNGGVQPRTIVAGSGDDLIFADPSGGGGGAGGGAGGTGGASASTVYGGAGNDIMFGDGFTGSAGTTLDGGDGGYGGGGGGAAAAGGNVGRGGVGAGDGAVTGSTGGSTTLATLLTQTAGTAGGKGIGPAIYQTLNIEADGVAPVSTSYQLADNPNGTAADAVATARANFLAGPNLASDTRMFTQQIRAGADTLYGGTGDDYIMGGNGNDLIIGGPGNDIIYGRGGGSFLSSDNDTFKWQRGDVPVDPINKTAALDIVRDFGQVSTVISGINVSTSTSNFGLDKLDLGELLQNYNSSNTTSGYLSQWIKIINNVDLTALAGNANLTAQEITDLAALRPSTGWDASSAGSTGALLDIDVTGGNGSGLAHQYIFLSNVTFLNTNVDTLKSGGVIVA